MSVVMCLGVIKHFYSFKLDIYCFLELKADNNNLCTVAFSNHTDYTLHWTNLQISSCNLLMLVINSQQSDTHLSDLNNLMNTFTPFCYKRACVLWLINSG